MQMAFTAQLLQRAGFDWWDMGQEHAYKLSMGAKLLSRTDFLRRFHELRQKENGLADLLASHPEPFQMQPAISHGGQPKRIACASAPA